MLLTKIKIPFPVKGNYRFIVSVFVVIFMLLAKLSFASYSISPTITSFSPGIVCSGNTVTITGTNFTGATAVRFGGVNVSSFIVNSSTSITAIAPDTTLAGVIQITTPGGTATSAGTLIVGSGATAYAYVSNLNDGTVSVINTSTNVVVATVPVAAVGISVSPDGSKVYVTTPGGNTISVINTSTNTVIATMTGGGSPYGISVSPDGSKIYVGNYTNGTVSVINTSTNAIIATVPVGVSPYGVSVSPDGSRVYVVNDYSGTVSVISTLTNTVIATVPVGYNPYGVSVSPDGSMVYVANYWSNSVSVINTSTNTVIATVPVGTNPYAVSVSPDGSMIYVANFSSNDVSVISTSTNAVVARVPAGNNPFGVSVSPDGSRVYVTNYSSNSVSVISTSTNVVIATVPVGNNPYGFGNFFATVTTPCTLSPTITFFTPSTASPDSVVTIKGTHFTGATTVSFGGTSAASFIVINDSTITAIVGAGASGNVSVGTTEGTAMLAGFVYIHLLPTITSFSSGTVCPGSTVTITGTNFTGATAVTFGGVNATSFTVNSPTSITALVGASTTGIIKVTTSVGTAKSAGTLIVGSGAASYAYIPNSGDNTVSVINTLTNTVVATVPAGISPWGISVSPDGSRLYITNSNFNSISIFNTLTNTVVATIPIASYGTTVSPDGSRLYVASGDSVHVINTLTNTVVATVPDPGAFWIIVSADGSRVYTTNLGFNTVGVINTSVNTLIATIPVETSPWGVVVSPDGSRVYVANSNYNSVSVINTLTNTVVATVPVGNSPLNISVSLDGSRLYVTNSSDNTVSVINTSTDMVIATIPVGISPSGISVSPDGSTAYVTNEQSNTVSVISTSTNAVIATIPVGSIPGGNGSFIATVTTPCILPPTITSFTPVTVCPGSTVTITGTNFTGATAVTFGGANAQSFTVNSSISITAIVPDTTLAGVIKVTATGGTATGIGTITIGGGATMYAYIPSANNGTVSVINTTTNAVTTTISVGSIPEDISISPDGNRVYVSNSYGNSVSVINTTTNSVIATIAMANGAGGVSVNPNGSKVYVLSDGSGNDVNVINTATNTITATIPVGNLPDCISISPDGSTLYVTNEGDSTVSVINTATNTVTTTIPVGNGPVGITSGPIIYVANSLSNSVSVINAANNIVTATIPVGNEPIGICVSPDGGKVYVTNYQDNNISVISAATNMIIATIAVGSFPEAINISPDGSNIYVTNNGNSTVSVINAAANTITATVPVGFSPRSLGNFIGSVATPCLLPPVITAFTPQSGSADTTVKISGAHFTGTTAVSFGGTPAASFIVINDSTITAIVGAGASGSVTVTTPQGTATAAGFVFTNAGASNINAVVTNPTCTKNNGSISVFPQRGKPPYVFSLNGNIQNNGYFSNLDSGSYSLVITDSNGIRTDTVITLTNTTSPPQFNAQILSFPTGCTGSNGSALINGVVGTPPYMYSMDDYNFQSNDTFKNISAGDYLATVIGADGCKSIQVFGMGSLTCDVLFGGGIGISCGDSGVIYLQPEHLDSTYTWSLDGINYTTNSSFSGLAPGIYDVYYKNTVSGNITIFAYPVGSGCNPSIFVNATAATCGSGNGMLNVYSVTEGTPPYLYTIDGVNFQSDSVFQGLAPGNYNVGVKDANGKIASGLTYVSASASCPPLEPSLIISEDYCGQGGSITVNVNGGFSPYKYSIDGISFHTGNIFSGLNAGSYSVIVKDSTGQTDTAMTTIRNIVAPVMNLGNDTSLCTGQTLQLSAYIPGNNVQYSWQDGSTNNTYLVSQAGKYWANAVANGCVSTDTIQVDFNPTPVVFLGNDTVLCEGITKLLDATNSNATYHWQDGNVNPTYLVQQAGLYHVTVDLNGCKASASVTINYLNQPVFDLGNTFSICKGQVIVLSPLLNTTVTYLWQDGSADPTLNVRDTGVYTLTTTNVCGSFTDSVTINSGVCELYMPSAFSPNNDGLDDVFKVKYPFATTTFDFMIYSRWGTKIFETNDMSVGWDGTYQGNNQPIDNYIWIISYTDINGNKKFAKGNVVLIR